MFIGKIPCPNPDYHFRFYYNEMACKDAMVLRVYQKYPDNTIVPGMIGKVIFRSKDKVIDNAERQAVDMAFIYNQLIADGHSDLVNYFKNEILNFIR